MIDAKVQEALDLLQEECAEIIQIISKIRRFGFDSYSPFDEKKRTNLSLLLDEMGDYEAVKFYLTYTKPTIDTMHVRRRRDWKLEKLRGTTSLFSD